MTADDPETTHVVTVFLRHDADVLLLRRSEAVGSYSGRWGAVAGHVERETRPPEPSRNGEQRATGAESGDPDAAAREEIREETGLDPATDVTRARRGDPFEVTDRDLGTRWVVHPSLFDAATREIETNYETAAHEWVAPTEILRRETVPDLWTSYDRVRPTVEAVADDREHGSAYLSVRALDVLRDEAALVVERGQEQRGTRERDPGREATDRTDLAALARRLRDARPAMPVVANRVNRVMAAALDEGEDSSDPARPTPAAVERAANAELDRALAADDRAAARAAERLPDRIATLSRSGTVLATLERAGPEFVLVAESRPGREGVATAERLAAATDADVCLTTDAAFGEELVEADVGALVVGADAVLPDGRVRNKVGTRGAACAAPRDCEVSVVAASDKVATADAADREERATGEVYDGDADLAVANPTFGVTPAECIDAVVTEDGVLDAASVREVADAHRERAQWDGADR